MKKMLLSIPADVHKKLKLEAVERGENLHNVAVEKIVRAVNGKDKS
jgi:hypothetical protein